MTPAGRQCPARCFGRRRCRCRLPYPGRDSRRAKADAAAVVSSGGPGQQNGLGFHVGARRIGLVDLEARQSAAVLVVLVADDRGHIEIAVFGKLRMHDHAVDRSADVQQQFLARLFRIGGEGEDLAVPLGDDPAIAAGNDRQFEGFVESQAGIHFFQPIGRRRIRRSDDAGRGPQFAFLDAERLAFLLGGRTAGQGESRDAAGQGQTAGENDNDKGAAHGAFLRIRRGGPGSG